MKAELVVAEARELAQPEEARKVHDFILKQASRFTSATYKTHLKDLYSHINKPAKEVTLSDVIGYKEELSRRRLKPATIALKLTVAREFFGFLKELGEVQVNPLALIKNPKVANISSSEALLDTEIKSLLGSINRSRPVGKRDFALLSLLYSAGLRVSELCNLKANCLEEREGKNGQKHIIIKVIGKGGKGRVVKVQGWVLQAIKDYQATQPRAEFLFTSTRTGKKLTPRGVQLLIKRRVGDLKKAGFFDRDKKVSPHSLRHTYATACLRLGAKPHKVQASLGHASIATTMRYYHELDELEDYAGDYLPAIDIS